LLLQAARLEAQRSKQLYPYSCDGSGWARPAWASYDSLMAPQVWPVLSTQSGELIKENFR
jgi:hypothetical protein